MCPGCGFVVIVLNEEIPDGVGNRAPGLIVVSLGDGAAASDSAARALSMSGVGCKEFLVQSVMEA